MEHAVAIYERCISVGSERRDARRFGNGVRNEAEEKNPIAMRCPRSLLSFGNAKRYVRLRPKDHERVGSARVGKASIVDSVVNRCNHSDDDRQQSCHPTTQYLESNRNVGSISRTAITTCSGAAQSDCGGGQ